MKDGHLNKCKKCTKNDVNKHRKENIDKIREYDRNRFQNDSDRRAYSYARAKTDRIKFPEKYKARTAVSNAIRDKKLKKMPCCVCGSEKSQAHHEDYSRPLDVIWLCVIHHAEID